MKGKYISYIILAVLMIVFIIIVQINPLKDEDNNQNNENAENTINTEDNYAVSTDFDIETMKLAGEVPNIEVNIRYNLPIEIYNNIIKKLTGIDNVYKESGEYTYGDIKGEIYSEYGNMSVYPQENESLISIGKSDSKIRMNTLKLIDDIGLDDAYEANENEFTNNNGSGKVIYNISYKGIDIAREDVKVGENHYSTCISMSYNEGELTSIDIIAFFVADNEKIIDSNSYTINTLASAIDTFREQRSSSLGKNIFEEYNILSYKYVLYAFNENDKYVLKPCIEIKAKRTVRNSGKEVEAGPVDILVAMSDGKIVIDESY